jgi:hypothetical protein
MEGKKVTYDEILQFLGGFESIDLSDMDSVKLLNRTEKKFVMHISKIGPLLKLAREEYKVLEINEQRLLEYSTEYFDTLDNAMYLAHHNGRQNRYKVRKREYMVSGEQFLEVKRRLTNGRTQKKRVEISGTSINETSGHTFIEAATPYQLAGLEKKLVNTFHRVTLMSDHFKERITIDMGLRFSIGEKHIELPSIAIIEIKKEKTGPIAGIELSMRKMGIHGSSVSKYCIGRALLEPKLKSNLFQNKIRYLIKLNALVHDHINTDED